MQKLTFDNIIYAIIIGYSFIFGGFLQFFLGVSNTAVISLSSILLLLIYFQYAFSKGKIIINGYILTSLIAISFVVLSSLLNSTKFTPTILYIISLVLPVTIYLTEKKRDALRYNLGGLKKILLLIALIQIPILLFQKNFYDLIIPFNGSRQHVALIDFSFGSFLLKNDHALGFFLISNFLYVSLESNLRLKKIDKNLMLLVIAISIFMLNSKLSVVLFLITTIYVFYQKSSFLRVTKAFKIARKYWFVLLSAILSIILLSYQPRIAHFFKQQINVVTDYETSLKHYLDGKAKRGHTINVWLHEEIRWIGDGPYSFYDISTGKYSDSSANFSQWLWAYHDIGLIGLFLFLLVFIFMMNTFREKKFHSLYLSFLFFMYGFFTIVMFDISFLLIYFIYKRKNAD